MQGQCRECGQQNKTTTTFCWTACIGICIWANFCLWMRESLNHYSRSSRWNSRIPIAKAYISGEFCWLYLGCLYTRPRLKTKKSRNKNSEYLQGVALANAEDGLDLTLGLQCAHHILVLPAHLVAQTAQVTEGASRLETHHPHCCRYHQPLALVIRRRAALKRLEPLKRFLPSLRLVWDHAW